MRLLAGKVCVITGAGSGVGRASALRFAAEEAHVVLADVRERWLHRTVALVEETGYTATAVQCDVTREADVASAIATAVKLHGRLDVMYNNVGVGTPKPGLSFVDHTDADWDLLLNVNLRGMAYGCRQAVLQFRAQGGGGVIVNTASVAGVVGFGGVPYGVSKAGCIQLTKGLAVELAPEGIRVNAYAPGTMITNFGRDESEAFVPPSEETIALFASYVPIGRPTTPQDCANVAVFLASYLAADLTGVVIPVDGGFLAGTRP